VLRPASCYLQFHYHVVRVWQKPVEAVLTGGLGTLPLAPLADVTRPELPGVIRRMEERISQEASPGEAGQLWTATFVLMGLRYSRSLARQLLEGVRAMKESVTYQAIVEEGIEEGRAREARAMLLRQGNKRFGPPSESVRTALEAISDIERLELLGERLLDVESWDELLAG
jgi:predicted transposase YdaD